MGVRYEVEGAGKQWGMGGGEDRKEKEGSLEGDCNPVVGISDKSRAFASILLLAFRYSGVFVSCTTGASLHRERIPLQIQTRCKLMQIKPCSFLPRVV